ncbi:MAG: hypothetical protein R2834_19590 [Rhodothermales bacterium]
MKTRKQQTPTRRLAVSTLILLGMGLLGCAREPERAGIEIVSSDTSLVAAFDWAREKALSYVQTGKRGPVDVWERGAGRDTVAYLPTYWAGYPGRSAFYSRDFAHQLTGAHLLGLGEENFTMMRAFAASADEGKRWFPLWAINFDGSPFALDYRGDTDFVREVPAVFELVEKAEVLYRWTGDRRYVEDEVLWTFYTKAVTDFVALHDDRLPNGVAEGTGEGIFAGAASYNESPDAPLIEAGDAIAAQYRAYDAYARIAALRGEPALADTFSRKADALKAYFNEEWGGDDAESYRRGYLASGEAVAGWGKENSWFMPMKGIVEAGSARANAYLDFIGDRLQSGDDMPDNIEALTYIPETFFLHHRNEEGWRWMKHIMMRLDQDHSHRIATGRNGDYPEVSYVLIQNAVVDLLGLSPDAGERRMATLSHLPRDVERLGARNIPMGDALLSVTHEAGHTSRLRFQQGAGALRWQAGFPGRHAELIVDGARQPAMQGVDHGMPFAYVTVTLRPGEEAVVTTRE